MANDVPSGNALDLLVDEVDVARFARLIESLRTTGVTVSVLRALQPVESAWLDKFTALDNATRDAIGDPSVPRSVDAVRERLAELVLDPEACFVACAGDRWVGYTLLDTSHSEYRVIRTLSRGDNVAIRALNRRVGFRAFAPGVASSDALGRTDADGVASRQ